MVGSLARNAHLHRYIAKLPPETKLFIERQDRGLGRMIERADTFVAVLAGISEAAKFQVGGDALSPVFAIDPGEAGENS